MSIEVLIPPYIVPQEESGTLVDDTTSIFRPTQAPGFAQRASFVEPRLRIQQSFKALRQNERGAMKAALRQVQGRFGTIRALVGYALRGSFPAAELLTNNTFANGTTGWTASAEGSVSVTDRILRLTRTASTTIIYVDAAATTVVPYAPYVGRAISAPGRGSFNSIDIAFSGVSAGPTASAGALHKYAIVPLTTSLTMEIADVGTSGQISGDCISIPYASLSRCALVDNGPNALTFSDQFDNAAWTKSNSVVVANAALCPDGTVTGDTIREDTANSTHYALQSPIAISSAGADVACAFAIRGQERSWAWLQIAELTSNTFVRAFFNLGSGSIGASTSVGANWSNLRSFMAPMGNGWYYCCIVARKTNSATQASAYVGLATGDGTAAYTGDGTSRISIWRGTSAVSAVPVRLSQTTSTALDSGTSQTGSALYIKGLPASTNGLLLLDDPFEINGELKQCTASLNSDAAGLGYLQFAPALVRSPADNDPVVIFQPMGKFILGGDPSWQNQQGVYCDLDLTLDAINE